ncbi:deoxynucleoside triphosphate triphosphohydrolase SAMHD1 homolog [Selaginella moellendorffii]|uniref:deoxynucleoside triphosphate triphosphohydrolase SAMHD1 homolog n=1 Tax=Selaginella moellendorffii TaxID=88036 RepID=UPI000D1C7B0F|nr:deoxynucleoside triphosphate triphosphohydrolase SAMHD1 homolog [Selaginella moellendorffii]|eukprot:XP_024538325.1 deoxynucleoside triphosphate triphosphohydrolase SAMHD1 homolog [Selaginella moellendorffii]
MGALNEDALPRSMQPRRRDKVILDNLHGNTYVDPLSLKFVDSLQFQRLRDIKQLGLCYLVYPGASHSRFEHSLGVYKLARMTVENLAKNPELRITTSDITIVSLAGLLHDVGHGPFSHVFDNEFLPRIMPGHKWSHEDMSTRMIDYIVDVNHIDISSTDLKRVKDMILCSKNPSLIEEYNEKTFLFDIVANGRNSIDVDKFDYILRDSRACGITSNFTLGRLMDNIKVIDNEICYLATDAMEVWNLFRTRADLFRKIYTHRKVKALELMLADVLVLSDDYLGISAGVFDPEQFWKMDDSLLKAIETSDVDELKEARELVWRMKRCGQGLYQFCNEYLVPKEKTEHFKDVTAKDIVCCGKSGAKISEDDIVVSNVKIDLACGKPDPLSGVHFFKEFDDSVKFTVDRQNLSGFYSDHCVDRIVRVYAKKPELVEAVSEAFEAFQLRTYDYKPQLHGTPDGKKRRKSGLIST